MNQNHKKKESSHIFKISKPQHSFTEIPDAMQHSIIEFTILCAIIVFCCIVFAIMSRSFKPLIAICLMALIWMYIIFTKCFPFMYGKAVYFEGDIIEQKGRAHDVAKGALAKKVMEGTGKYLYVKHGIDMYKITIPSFKEEYGRGGKVRVYFERDGRYEQNEHYFVILEPLLIESLEVNVD